MALQGVRGRVAKGAILVTGGRVLGNLLTFGGMIVLARVLTPADFGLVALATTVLGMLSAVTNVPLSAALIQHSAPTHQHMDTAFTLNSMRGLAVAAAGCLIALPLAYFTKEPRLVALVAVLSTTLIIEGVANPRVALTLKDLRYGPTLLLQISQKVASLLVSLGIALAFRSYWALALGTLAGQAVSTAISYAVLPYRPRLGFQRLPELWSFSVWLTLGQAVATLTARFDAFLVGTMLGRTTLGHYTVGENLAVMPTKEATMPLYATLFPAFARLKESPQQVADAYQRAQMLLTAVALPLGAGIALIADPLVRVAIGDKWALTIPVVQVLGVVFATQTLGSLVHSLGMATGHTRLLFRRDMIVFVTRVPIVLALMLVAGLPGFLLARAIAGVIDIWANLSIARHVTGLGYRAQVASNGRTVACVLLMSSAVLAIPSMQSDVLQIAVSVIVGAAVYTASRLGSWLLLSQPSGPEAEILSVVSGMLKTRVARRSSSP
jgi:lipopolysaccharide exporter